MATSKKTAESNPTPKTAKKATSAPAAAHGGPLKPIKDSLNKTSLIAHLAQHSGVEAKAVKAVLGSLEATMMASVHKKGLGAFTLPGIMKIQVVNVPAKKKRTGIDPFTKVERVFAAKPATVKIKVRALKKVKDAAL